jgi:D-arabinose 1-dehydrogenase-like Zn-dependent alcohol dehydrogenase
MARAQKTHAPSIFFSEIKSNMSSVRSMNELLQLQNAAEAFDLLMSGKARFRAVLATGH